jgi:hypothetical protein
MKAENCIPFSDFRFHPCIWRASPVALFEQPARGFFDNFLVYQ